MLKRAFRNPLWMTIFEDLRWQRRDTLAEEREVSSHVPPLSALLASSERSLLVHLDLRRLKVLTADHPVQELSKMIERKGNEMELKSVLGEVKGFDPWKPENRLGTKTAV